MATNTVKFKKTLVRDSWIRLMNLYWFFVINGAATVLLIYGLVLILHR